MNKEIIPERIFNTLLRLRGKLGPDPYRLYNHQYKCIFIHVPKTGGTSVYNTLFQTKRSHIDLKYFEAYDKKLFNKYFKFAVVRNPYDRLVSSYFYMMQVKDHNVKWVNKNIRDTGDFQSFVESLKDRHFRATVFSHIAFRPQVDFISNLQGKVDLDYMARFENLETDFLSITNRLGLKVELIHRNKSSHKKYTDYYNANMLEIVGHVYHNDFNTLGYSRNETVV